MSDSVSLAQDSIGRKWSQRFYLVLLAMLLLAILVANFVIGFFQFFLQTGLISPEVFYGALLPFIFSGPCLLAWFLALGSLHRWKRFSMVLLGHFAVVATAELGIRLSPERFGEGNPIWTFYVLSVIGISIPAQLIRLARNVRFVRNEDSHPTNFRVSTSRQQELLLYFAYAVVTCTVISLRSGFTNPISDSVVNALSLIGFLVVFGFIVTVPLMLWIRSRRYILVSLINLSLVAFLIAPLIAAIIIVMNAGPRLPLRFLIHTREFVMTETSMISTLLICSLLVICVRRLGYELIWPKFQRRIVQTSHELEKGPHPLD